MKYLVLQHLEKHDPAMDHPLGEAGERPLPSHWGQGACLTADQIAPAGEGQAAAIQALIDAKVISPRAAYVGGRRIDPNRA